MAVDTLCRPTSSFVDDFMFSCNGASGGRIKHGVMFRPVRQMAAPVGGLTASRSDDVMSGRVHRPCGGTGGKVWSIRLPCICVCQYVDMYVGRWRRVVQPYASVTVNCCKRSGAFMVDVYEWAVVYLQRVQSSSMGEERGHWWLHGRLLGVWRPALQTVRRTNLHISGKE